jgi:hypothetical protein
MAEDKGKRRKPVGRTGPIRTSSEGLTRNFVQFPEEKAEIELMIAQMFVQNGGPHAKRWGPFEDLQQLRENNIDFSIKTNQGTKYMELAEFAPLNSLRATGLKPSYENAPSTYSPGNLLLDLIREKSAHQGGKDCFLLVYKTHETFFVPPPVYHAIAQALRTEGVKFEAIYFLSPKPDLSAMIFEIYPGTNDPNAPVLPLSTRFEIGFGGFEPGKE